MAGATMKIVPLPDDGDVVASKYRVVRLLGQGGMGAVFEAVHTETGKPVALKWLLPEGAADPKFRERFLQEARAAGRIHHPNVVDIYDVGSHNDTPFIVMEMLVGEALADRLERGATSVEEVISWSHRVASALQAAHDQGVVHRDLKPDNVFLCTSSYGEPIPKVLDFGISMLTEADHRLTQSGATLGTPYYMAPEQVRGEPSVDARADIYSLGVMLFEAFTGQLPFDGESYGAIAIEIATANVPDVSELRGDVPPEVDAVVRRAMSRDPLQRYQTMAELADALRDLTERGTAPPVAPEASAPASMSAALLIGGAALAALAVVAVVAAVVLGGDRAASPSAASPRRDAPTATPAVAAPADLEDDVVPAERVDPATADVPGPGVTVEVTPAGAIEPTDDVPVGEMAPESATDALPTAPEGAEEPDEAEARPLDDAEARALARREERRARREAEREEERREERRARRAERRAERAEAEAQSAAAMMSRSRTGGFSADEF